MTVNTTTLANEYAKQGRDWETELRQRAKEVALVRELGLTESQAQPSPGNSPEVAPAGVGTDPDPEMEEEDDA